MSGVAIASVSSQGERVASWRRVISAHHVHLSNAKPSNMVVDGVQSGLTLQR